MLSFKGIVAFFRLSGLHPKQSKKDARAMSDYVRVLSTEMHHQLSAGISDAVKYPMESALRNAHEQVSVIALKALLAQGLSLSSIAGALSAIAFERGQKKAVGLLEQAAELLQQDETTTPEQSV